MTVLITNDDGIESPGLKAIALELEKDHEVWVVAPDGDRSGYSHSLTLREPVKFRLVRERWYACTGSPADCVLFSDKGAIPTDFDMVVSGINLGPNLGSDIIFSGTAAAARQAAFMGYPSIAVSVGSFVAPFYFEHAARFVRKNLSVMKTLWNNEHFININVPNTATPPTGVVITHLAHIRYEGDLVSFSAPTGEVYYFLHGSQRGDPPEDDSDWGSVTKGKISVSPVNLLHCLHEEEERYHSTQFSI
jgi:5'-nucleotidase